MAEQEIPYDAIIRTEIAIDILNQARAIVTARVYELEGMDPEAAEAPRTYRRSEQRWCCRSRNRRKPDRTLRPGQARRSRVSGGASSLCRSYG
jgi:hypothetical protein